MTGSWSHAGGRAIVGVASLVGAALAVDVLVRDEEDARLTATELPAEADGTIRPVPVLDPGVTGEALAVAVGELAIAPYSADARGDVLGTWGVAIASVLDIGIDGFADPEEPPPELSLVVFVDDPRLVDPAARTSFVDPCVERRDDQGCPAEDESAPVEVLTRSRVILGPNSASVVAFPHHDVASAASCRFASLDPDEIPVVVVTANPSSVDLRVGDDSYEIVTEPDAARIEGDRVPHCIAVRQPPDDGAIRIVATATDDLGQVAVAETIVLSSEPDRLPPTATPLDGTMLRVDVPLAAGIAADVTLHSLPEAFGGTATDDCRDAPVLPSGWRPGHGEMVEPTARSEVDPADRAYLDATPRVLRATLALPEGQPSMICVTYDDDTEPARFVATPPDARRFSLALGELLLDEPIEADQFAVRGTFTELGWSPCNLTLDALPAGLHTFTGDGVLCSSDGDTGALAAAGGVLDLEVRNGDAVHRARILVAGAATAIDARYRLPIPAIDQVGPLCTPGVAEAECTDPTGAGGAGEAVITVTWDDGPVGPSDWTLISLP